MVELSPRLEQIGRMVAQGSVVADIGTDHGQLMAWLGERGILRAGYACDINKKPLDKARRILAELGLSDMVACVQAPGLEGLEPEITDTLPAKFYCSCSKERIEKAIISIGKKDIKSMIDDGEDIEVKCHFCNTSYKYTVDELKELLKKSR